MKKIVIAGGTGFLGTSLESFFKKKGDDVIVLSRKPHFNHTYWNGKQLGSWVNDLENADVLINLSGKSVDCRYNAVNRDKILKSRINSTSVLSKAVSQCKKPPKIWLNASSATIYIHAENNLMTEKDGIVGDDFSTNICKKWEAEFFKENHLFTRKVALRIAIVLSKKGGGFPKMSWLARLGFGGKQGIGNQLISWIHIDDFCRAIDFITENNEIDGVVNITAPKPVTNKFFMKELRSAMHIAIGIPLPRVLLEVGAFLISTETELLLKSRKVYPEKLLQNGFSFQYESISKSLVQLVK